MSVVPEKTNIMSVRLGDIRTGWILVGTIALLISLWPTLTVYFPEELRSWLGSAIRAVGLLLFIAEIARRFYRSNNVIGATRDLTAEENATPRTSGPKLSLLECMLVPVLGYSTPIALAFGVHFIFVMNGPVMEGAAISGVVFLMTLPLVLFFALMGFEMGRPGEFGPENYKMPTRDDPNP